MLSTITCERCEFDMDLDPAFQADTHIIAGGALYEGEIGDAIQRILQPDDVAVDVGANVGFFTCMMASLVGPRGRVYAFEPDAANLPRLEGNIELNGFYQVEVIHQPAWSSVVKMLFYHSFDDSGGSALWNPGVWYANSKTRCAHASGDDGVKWRITVTLDAFVPRQPRLIKVDTEGAELRVLKGAMLLLQHRPFVLCELNPFGLRQLENSVEELRTFMAERGYGMYALGEDMITLISPVTHVILQNDLIINVLFADPAQVGALWEKVHVPK